MVGEFDIPEVSPLDADAVAALRREVERDASAGALAAEAAAQAEAILPMEPTPLRVIHYEGLVNTDPRRIDTVKSLKQMGDVAWLMRHWQASGDPRCVAALKAAVVAWANTYEINGNDVNENKFFPLLVAYDALRDGFAEDDRARIDAWVRAMGEIHLVRVQSSDHFTNRYNKSVRMVAMCGRILDEPAWTREAVAGVERFVTHSLRADGTSLDLEERDSLTYHGSALKPPLELAALLGEAGADLYDWESPQGGSLRRSVEYMVPYATGEKTHKEWVNTTIGLDRRRAEAGLEAYRPGRLYEPSRALGVLEAACAFDAELLPIVAELAERPGATYPTWRTLSNAMLSAPE
ncbi:MAG: alginate lyase family protein [Planctomycetota bacterium]